MEDLPLRILNLADFPGVALPAEGAESYADNALAKARAVAAATGRWALGDDSGLEVDALGGGPGILSARYGGEGLDDAGRRQALLGAVAGVPPKQRTARFRTLIALCQPGGREAVVEGACEGVLAPASRGAGGFGYDAIFYYPPLGATFGELSQQTKDVISARGVALARARAVLLHWLAASSRLLTVLLFAVTLLGIPAVAGAAVSWKTHHDRNCGIELKYPEAYVLEASGAPDFCVLWIPLAPGVNTLVLSVEGKSGSGEPVADTHRLRFRVDQ